jgi:hypothetical protein
MTLPAGVDVKSHSGTHSTTFAQSGQDLTWSNINLARRGATKTIRLKVNVTDCADGQLAFAAVTTVGGACPTTTATPATATVKHAKGWVACPSGGPCDIERATGIFACPPGVSVCGDRAPIADISTPLACAQKCLDFSYGYAAFSAAGGGCYCYDYDEVTGTSTNSPFTTYAVGEARDPPETPCP